MKLNDIRKMIFASVTIFAVTQMLAYPSSTLSDEITDFITEDAIVAVIATPEKAMLEPALDLLPREIFSVMSEDELGFDVTKMKKLTFIVEKMESMDGPPGIGLMMRFAEPQSLSENLVRQFTKQTLAGKTYYAAPEENQPGLMVYDDKTIMFGMASTLEKMVSVAGAKSTLIDLVKRKHTDDHFQAFVDFKTIRPFIKENFGAQLRSVPAPFADLAELPFQISSARLTINLGEKGKISLVMAADDQDSAIAANDAINSAIDNGRVMLEEQMLAGMDGENPRLRDAAQQYFARIGDKVVAEMKPKRTGSNLMWNYEDSAAMMTTYAGVTAAMLLPAVQATRAAARRTSSANNLRQLMLAALNFESVKRRFPARANVDSSGKPLLSWRVHLLPYLEEQALYEEFHLDEPWDSAHNKKLIARMPRVYQCPNLPEVEGKTVYLAITGDNTAFDGDEGRRIREFVDGTSNTAMFVEADMSEAVTWTKPDDWEFRRGNPMAGLGGINPGIFQVAFADGSVRSISMSTDPDVWLDLVTVDGRRGR